MAVGLLDAVEKIEQWAQRNNRIGDFRDQLFDLDAEGLSPLHRACEVDWQKLVGFLIERGADANVLDKEGQTPLFYARSPHVVEELIRAGANPDARWRGQSLADHWTSWQKRNPNLAPWPQMLDKLISCSPEKQAEVLENQAWMWFDSSGVGSLNTYMLSGAQSTKSQWEQGWLSFMKPALEGKNLHEFSRKVNSGLLRGEASLIAEMGARWMRDEMSPHVWFGLMESPKELFGAGPRQIRKGLEDWGVFALGAARHLRESKFNHATTDNLNLYLKDRKVLSETMASVAGVQQWEDHMMRAAAALQRAKNAVAWRDVSQCVCSYLESLGASDPQRKLALIQKGMKQGFRWVSSNTLLTPFSTSSRASLPKTPIQFLTEMADGLKANPIDSHSRQDLLDAWMNVALDMVVSTLEFSEFASNADSQNKDGLRPELKDFVRVQLPRVLHWGAALPPDSDGRLKKRLEPFLPLLTALAPEVFSGLTAARLDRSLPPSATVSVRRHRM